MEEKEIITLESLIEYAYHKFYIKSDECRHFYNELNKLREAKYTLDSRKMKPKYLVGEEVYAIVFDGNKWPVVSKVVIESTDWYADKQKFHYNYKYYDEDLCRTEAEVFIKLGNHAAEVYNTIMDKGYKQAENLKKKEGDK